MNDDGITAFRAPPRAAAPPRGRRGPWRWLLLSLLVLAAVSAGSLAAIAWMVGQFDGPSVSVTIDGETWNLSALHGGHWALAGGALLLAGLLVLLVVPALVLVALLAAAAGVGVALIALLAVVGVALVPLLLLGALVWWAVRPARPRGS
jgi:hypothetical protein